MADTIVSRMIVEEENDNEMDPWQRPFLEI